MTARVVQTVRIAATAPRFALMAAVRLYQWTLSPLLGPRCKYYPSCSHYGYESLRRHGALKGVALTAWRIARCNPWSHGGVDDVPAVGQPLFRRHVVTQAPAPVSTTSSSAPTT